MEIDLTLLHSNTVEEIDITNTYNIPKEYFENTDIIALNDVKVEGKIVRKENDDLELVDYIDCKIYGDMIIPDSISLEEVKYPFSIEYDDFLDENYKNGEKALDIFQFLCENIVLEVPLQFTKVEDLSEFHGDGWKLISEDDYKTSGNNPFSDLLKNFEEE